MQQATITQTNFQARSIDEFIVSQISRILEMPQEALMGLMNCVTEVDSDPVVEMSYEAYKSGTLQSCDTLAFAR